MDKLKRVEVAFRESERCLRGIFKQTSQFTRLTKPSSFPIEVNYLRLDLGRFSRSEVISRSLCKTSWWKTLKAISARLGRKNVFDNELVWKWRSLPSSNSITEQQPLQRTKATVYAHAASQEFICDEVGILQASKSSHNHQIFS